ncbi:TRAP transporter small permease subunit [Alteromonas sp. H39]|uniref:TRAP transporter small permease subunit n=1 Tax=Alteromonas sp. H39 TaxID=3389876 RepID=UPI0039DFAE55
MSTPSSNHVDEPAYRTIDKFNAALCRWVSIGTLIMVLLTFLIVVLRYGFQMGWIALQESVMYLHALVFMVGIAHTLRAEGHVRVDVLYRKMSARSQAWVNLVGTLVFLVPVCITVAVISFPYVAESWKLLESSQEAGGLPLVFLLKSLIPLFAGLTLLQGLSDIARYAHQLKGGAR